jgi:EAL domain-containing protein (putative c-di-GMP-specific phosphodiesterase class I)
VRALGCDCAQGYLFAPPLDADSFTSWLVNRGPVWP